MKDGILIAVTGGLALGAMYLALTAHLKLRGWPAEAEHRHARYPVKASRVPPSSALSAAMGVTARPQTDILFRCESCTEPDAYVSVTLDGTYILDDLRLLPDDQYIQPEEERDGAEVPAS